MMAAAVPTSATLPAASPTARAPRAGLRERSKLDKRRRIMEAAREVFIEHGYEAATTREIAVRAEVSIGTVFVYAKDKRDLLLLIINDELDAIGAKAATTLNKPGTLRERLLAYFRLRYRYWAAEPRLARPALAETYDFVGVQPSHGDEARRFLARRAVMQAQIDALLVTAQSAGELVADVRTEQVAALIVDIYLIEVRRWLADEAPRLAAGMARLDGILALLLRGVVRPATT